MVLVLNQHALKTLANSAQIQSKLNGTINW